MKVIDAINRLQHNDPNDEIVIMWWAKGLFEDNEDEEIAFTNDMWNEMVKEVDNYLDYSYSEIYEVIEGTLWEMGQE